MLPADSSAQPEPRNLAALWAHWPGAAFRLDAVFRWVWLGESVAALTGRSAQGWLADATAWERAVHPHDRTRHAAHRQSLAHQPHGAGIRFRLLHAQTGSVIWLHEFCVPQFDAAGNLRGFEGLWINDARTTQLERHLAAAAWSETLAAMSAGLAHDFNNVLTGVISLSEHFLTQIAPDHSFHEGLTQLHNHGHEASRWIQRFGQLQQIRPGAATWHDVNELVADTVLLLRHTLSRRFELTTSPSPQPEPVMVETGGFQRALFMLVFRAVARMPHPAPVRLQVAHNPTECGTAPAWVRVGVEISGELAPPTRAGEGDAALSAVGQFIARLGGKLEIDQRTADGTTTWLSLPGATAELSVVEPVVALRPGWIWLGGGTQPQVDEWADWLRGRSFLVTVSASDAIELPDADDYPLDAAVIVVDAVAPDAAMRFLERLRAARPELPAITVLSEDVGFETEAVFSQVTAVVPAGANQRERLLGKLTAALKLR